MRPFPLVIDDHPRRQVFYMVDIRYDVFHIRKKSMQRPRCRHKDSLLDGCTGTGRYRRPRWSFR